jgi:predicted PurR-regulated permease PerM
MSDPIARPSVVPGEAARAEEPTTFPTKEEQPRVLLHMPVDVRSMALVVLTVLAMLAVLRWASPVFIPFMIGLMFSYALSPAVDWMQRKRIPRAIGAGVLMVAIITGLGFTAWSLADDASELIESLPVAAQKLRDAVRARQGKETSTLDTVQKAAAELERAAEDGNAVAAARRGVMKVEVQKPKFNVKDYLWTGTVGLLSLVGQATVVIFLTYFLLLSGNTFRRKLVKIAGPSLTTKKITVQALDEITGQIQRYLLVQLLASVLVGITTGLAFWAMGLEHAAVWGIAAAVLNLIPYIGSIVVTAGAALVAFMQFGSVNMALYIGGISLLINTIEGNLMVPWLTSKASRMNPVAVFIGVLAWGWLWGVWGLLLGIPILMAVKAVCDRVEDLKPVGELLGA